MKLVLDLVDEYNLVLIDLEMLLTVKDLFHALDALLSHIESKA